MSIKHNSLSEIAFKRSLTFCALVSTVAIVHVSTKSSCIRFNVNLLLRILLFIIYIYIVHDVGKKKFSNLVFKRNKLQFEQNK
jgi:hypothetical protein